MVDSQGISPSTFTTWQAEKVVCCAPRNTGSLCAPSAMTRFTKRTLPRLMKKGSSTKRKGDSTGNADFTGPVKRLIPVKRPIRPFGVGVYWVPSNTTSEEYLVDMSDPDFPSGRCNCKHFECRIEPSISRGLPVSDMTCPHIRRVSTELSLRIPASVPKVSASVARSRSYIADNSI